ncbi:54S ribosomal protein L17 mitochondrial, partial [Goodea atripinnis]
LIDYGKKGDTDEKAMKMASFWLTVREKDLVPKLFKVLAPRFENQSTGYTRMARIPNRENLDRAKMAVLEYKGNPFPPLYPVKKENELTLLNQLLKGYREERARVLAAEA